ncbi:SMP-30/gluconolactonase/LRE family protein [Rhodococcus rhodochrous]|uniref:SMP-30/gluconolactonase/LRE family protein n=1 Tax=Rhodococcus rhodochrous TaxID=1829 RepID=A0AAW4XND8_RHORH|nr:SMP-30/gluconolactonase/LRE family protein [Rhodococcus rhodochrous]MCD2114592.1 SMP-30/gluconolactonase/LRE family protein [Rhodococcus rhodochrous]
MRMHHFTEFSAGHGYLEAPRYRDGKLWVSDFFAAHVITVDTTDGSIEKIFDVPNSPSGLGFLSDGSLLVVSQHDHKLLHRAVDGTVTVRADLAPFCGGDANDMLVHNDHAYIGNFGFDLAGGAEPRTTRLIHVSPSGGATQVPGDTLFPNGTEVHPNGTTVLLAETLAHKISAFDLTPDGTLGNYRLWAQLPDTHNPDGIAVDADGGVWYANALTEGPESGFYRVEEGGVITDAILVPDAWGVAATFGGPDNDILYLVTNATTLSDFAEGKSAGRIRMAHVGRRGAN